MIGGSPLEACRFIQDTSHEPEVWGVPRSERRKRFKSPLAKEAQLEDWTWSPVPPAAVAGIAGRPRRRLVSRLAILAQVAETAFDLPRNAIEGVYHTMDFPGDQQHEVLDLNRAGQHSEIAGARVASSLAPLGP